MLFDNPPKPRHYYILPIFVLAILALYTYGRFFTVPYVGFQINGPDGEITEIFVENDELQVGEHVLQINDITLAAYNEDFRNTWLLGFEPGERIQLSIDHEGQTRQVGWVVPGFNLAEFWTRLLNTWWVSFAFWLAGTVILLLVRPEDLRWRLLVAFNYITAIWFISGSISTTGVYYSPLVFRTAIWLSLPIYLQLHWVFPHHRWRLPAWIWPSLYVVSIALGLLHWTRLIPTWLYTIPLLVGVLGSLAMLLARLFQPRDRREVVVLLISTAIAFAPSLIAAVITARGESQVLVAGLVASLLTLPGAYLYIIARRQLGGLELRANRLISLYLFFVLLLTVTLAILPILSPYLENPSEVAAAIFLTGIAISLFSVFGFTRFQRFIERRLLRIPMPPERLIQDFASRISTSFELEHLVNILQKQVLPSMLIRQSALVLAEPHSDGPPVCAYLQGVGEAELPDATALGDLFMPAEAPSGQAAGSLPASADWIQLAVLVEAGGEPQAVWLLGRKDPDDYYSYAERQTLSSLADQMGIALVNIKQNSSLRALYQQDIDRQEAEQAHLARELHDDMLQEVNSLFRAISQKGTADGFSAQLLALNDRVRQLIHGLRPAMLDFGLYRALAELIDDLAEQLDGKIAVQLMVPESAAAYDPRVTEHVYRIVQQAARNAVRYSQAKELCLEGVLEDGRIHLRVIDDGIGFTLTGQDLSALLRDRHYGLVNMKERAALVGAQLSIDSNLGHGTQVSLYWEG